MVGESSAQEYQERVQGLERTAVVEMWNALRAGAQLRGWPPGKGLEYLLLRAYQLEGAEVTWPYSVSSEEVLEQIDGAVSFDGLWCLLECKHQRRPVGIDPIIKLKARLTRRTRATLGAVFSVSGFTESATKLLRMLPPVDVLLWTGKDMDWALWEGRLCEGTRQKLRAAVEYGLADKKLVEEGR